MKAANSPQAYKEKDASCSFVSGKLMHLPKNTLKNSLLGLFLIYNFPPISGSCAYKIVLKKKVLNG